MSFIFWVITLWLMSRVYLDMLPPRLAHSLGFDGQPLVFDDK